MINVHTNGLFFTLFKMIFTENKPSTEPFSFIFLKKLCSVSLIIILLFYTYNQFSIFSKSINQPNITFRKGKLHKNSKVEIIVLVCSSYPVNCTYSTNNKCELPDDRDINSTCENGAPNFYAFKFQEKINITITPFVTEVYLKGLVMNKKTYPTSRATNSLS